MAKLYLSELSAALAEKHGIDRRTAQRFVTSVVAVVQNGLENDRMVKIKGLGTFKVIDVEARESVNVNTGERLVIDSHSKLTFLPDNAMKELVNRPFSQFETVVLNDGVSFDDEPEEESVVTDVEEEVEAPVSINQQEEKSVEIIQPVADMPKVNGVETEETEQAVEAEAEQAIETEETGQAVEAEETGQAVETEETGQAVETEETERALPPGWRYDREDNESDEKSNPFKEMSFGWWHLVAIALLALSVGGGIGYWVGSKVPTPAAPEAVQQVSKNEPKVEETVPNDETAEVEEESQDTDAAEDASTPIWEKYNDMDSRTRSGYYYITGLDRIEKAKAGDTSVRISRRVFGAAELACYIEVFNGIDGSTVLEEGTEVKIPVIEPKKTVRKRLEQQNNQQ